MRQQSILREHSLYTPAPNIEPCDVCIISVIVIINYSLKESMGASYASSDKGRWRDNTEGLSRAHTLGFDTNSLKTGRMR